MQLKKKKNSFIHFPEQNNVQQNKCCDKRFTPGYFTNNRVGEDNNIRTSMVLAILNDYGSDKRGGVHVTFNLWGYYYK